MNAASNIEHESFMSSLMVFVKGSLIFVVSQAWNTAIQNLITTSGFADSGRIYYALGITFFSIYVLKMFSNIGKIIETCKTTLNGKCQQWWGERP